MDCFVVGVFCNDDGEGEFLLFFDDVLFGDYGFVYLVGIVGVGDFVDFDGDFFVDEGF